MTTMVEIPRDSKPWDAQDWTVDDLEDLPDDGRRYELLDGQLLVSPAPGRRHQAVSFELGKILDAARPPELAIMMAPLDWQPSREMSFQPDILVIQNTDMNARNVTEPMVLAVEVLSPTSRQRDLVRKRSVYESAGVSSYWVVDPERPSVLAWHLVDGRYQVAGPAEGDQELDLMRPFPVAVVPSALVAPYNW